MRRPLAAAVTLLLACSVLLAGCAGASGAPDAPTDPFGCGIVVTPQRAVVGENVTISRPATESGEICTTLAPGTTQTL
ncbi:hypothetical protein E3O42_01005 [Cryobacterium adonitolivorans]|uniref:Uncharacterized protein n=1 Tax=Cryobacterium adonitolivorans TaxID=1259189 RepID=A0A4R8WCZ5_9MICO|nr:hypothetical protein [Cryobacterium adonitolivorans]TFC06991.1 hypothetical protein E3O42_01005 [Cryobacterium adonitolivorans]